MMVGSEAGSVSITNNDSNSRKAKRPTPTGRAGDGGPARSAATVAGQRPPAPSRRPFTNRLLKTGDRAGPGRTRATSVPHTFK